MTPDPQQLIEPPATTAAPHSRLELKPDGPTTGSVDGAWWPRSTALAPELSALLEHLGGASGDISRVTYHRRTWDPAPRRMPGAGHRIALDGFPYATDPHTVTLIAASGRRTTLLVVPPDADDIAAHRALATASTAGNADTTASLLATILESA
jgi:hypothetical protein